MKINNDLLYRFTCQLNFIDIQSLDKCFSRKRAIAGIAGIEKVAKAFQEQKKMHIHLTRLTGINRS